MRATRLITAIGIAWVMVCACWADSSTCAEDIDGNGRIDSGDLTIVLLNFGLTPATYEEGDVTVDGQVDLFDLTSILELFGAECSPPLPCPGDLNRNGKIEVSDLSILLSNFGLRPAWAEQGDVDNDFDVDLQDLLILSMNLGVKCAHELADCRTSLPSWTNQEIAPQQNLFAVAFDAVPRGSNIDGLTALGPDPLGAYEDLAVAIRFNVGGAIDARDGDTYRADEFVAYDPNTIYSFRLVVSVPDSSYSIFVTPQAQAEVLLGQNYAFRPNHANGEPLRYVGIQSGIGTHDTCNLVIESGSNAPPLVEAGGDQNLPYPKVTSQLVGTASDDGKPNGTFIVNWSQVSGPPGVVFTDPGAPATPVAFPGPGTYVLRLSASDGEFTTVDSLTVTVQAPAPPELVVWPTALNFGPSSDSQTLLVRNAGSGSVSYVLASDADWMTITPASGASAGEDDAIVVTVDRAGLPDGLYTGTIDVNSDAGPLAVPVQMSVGTSVLPMNTAHRTRGTAPLAVYFSTTPGSGVVQPELFAGQPDYPSFDYQWNFGDLDSGTWATTGNPRNTASGHNALHVFDEPGEYNVTLQVIDTDGNVLFYEQTISVDAFDGTTVYVAANGNDSNDGLSPDHPLRSFQAGLGRQAPNTRILFRRGDSFNANGGAMISTFGPLQLGAYGPGESPDARGMFANAPQIVTPRDVDLIRLSGSTSERNLVISDLDFVCSSPGGLGVAVQGSFGTQRGWLVYRTRIRGFGYGVLTNGWYGNTSVPSPETMHARTFVVDSEISNTTIWTAYMGGRQIALLGNHLFDSERSHVVRLWSADHSLIAENDIHDSGNGLHCLKLHNDSNGNYLWPGRFTIVADNRFQAGGVWPIAIGPQDETMDERIEYLLFERNLCLADANTQVSAVFWVSYSTVRNNIVDGTGASTFYRGLNLTQRGVEPPPIGNRVLHNTIFRADGSSEFIAATIDSAASEVENNLAIPGSAGEIYGFNGASDLFQLDNLLWNGGTLPNAASGDYRPPNGSLPIDAGHDAGLPYDYERQTRSGPPDIGAVENPGG